MSPLHFPVTAPQTLAANDHPSPRWRPLRPGCFGFIFVQLKDLMTSRCPSLFHLNKSNQTRRVLVQKPDRADVKVVQEVGIRRSSVWTLVLHQVALQGLLAGVSLLNQPQLKTKNDKTLYYIMILSVATNGIMI